MSLLVAGIKAMGSHLWEVAGYGGAAGPSREGFRLELAKLGLLGRGFDVEVYARALGNRLGISIRIELLPDAWEHALMGREFLAEGTLAEVLYREDLKEAWVLVRESLRLRPWPAYELAVYHELSHLAAGHPARAKRERGRSAGEEAAWESVRGVYEPEARQRARWLVVAAAHPEAFEREGADRVN